MDRGGAGKSVKALRLRRGRVQRREREVKGDMIGPQNTGKAQARASQAEEETDSTLLIQTR